MTSLNFKLQNVSLHISHKKNCCDLNLGESLCISTLFPFPDSRLNLLNGFDPFFDLFWMAWHWKPAIGNFRVHLCLCFKTRLSAKPFSFYQNEFCIKFHFHANQSHFHTNGFALRLALRQRARELGNGLFTMYFRDKSRASKWSTSTAPTVAKLHGIASRIKY